LDYILLRKELFMQETYKEKRKRQMMK